MSLLHTVYRVILSSSKPLTMKEICATVWRDRWATSSVIKKTVNHLVTNKYVTLKVKGGRGYVHIDLRKNKLFPNYVYEPGTVTNLKPTYIERLGRLFNNIAGVEECETYTLKNR